MNCPQCNEELHEVWVTSECHQTAYVKDGEVGDYGSATIGNIIRIECALCGCDVTKVLS